MQSFLSRFPKFNRYALDAVSTAFLFVIFMTGLAGALRIPALTVYLHNEITTDPMLIGAFYSINSLVSMLLSQIIAHYSDRYPNRRMIISISCLMQLLGCLLFAFNRNYYILLIFGTVILGLGSSVTSQLFALSREYSKTQNRDSVLFNSVLRAQLSLAWIIGPPMAYLLSEQLGFTFMYCTAATIFAISIIVVKWTLPQAVHFQQNSAIVENVKISEHNVRENNRPSVILLSLCCLLVLTCNSMMFINLPIYLTQSLHLPNQLAGLMMGTAAAIEIPVMLISGYCSRFVSKKTLMLIAILAGLSYYFALSLVQSQWQLFAIQLFNGLFIGIIASIGMLYFQDLMPNKMGTATTLFSNTGSASWIVAGQLTGLTVSQFGYSRTWDLACILCGFAFLLMLGVRRI